MPDRCVLSILVDAIDRDRAHDLAPSGRRQHLGRGCGPVGLPSLSMLTTAGARRRLPWARPRFELVLLALVAVATVSPVLAYGDQDQSRLCLTEAFLHGNVSNDACLANAFDHSVYAGHLYSDKAPGLSVLAIPAVALLQPSSPEAWSSHDIRLWGVRVLTVGVAFILCAFMVGRVSEGLAPGFGGISLVTFALGTLVAPLGAVMFEHVPAATLAFAGFLFAWSRRPLLAGLLAGAALLVEYETGLILLVLGCYVAVVAGRRPLGMFLAGVVPGAVLLGAYDQAAFGAPWHLSYRYIGNVLASEQSTGFFGITTPHAFGITQVFAGSRGLLVVSPVLVMAVFGLARLGRVYRPEAIVAGVVTALFVLADCGYFDPYGGWSGGFSPGPRFLVAAIPFLALGLGPSFNWRPRLTLVAALISVIATTVVVLTWTTVDLGRGGGVWGEFARLPSKLGSSVPTNLLSVVGLGPTWGALLVLLATVAAVGIGMRQMPWREIRRRPREAASRRRPSPRAVLVVVVCVYLVVAANVLAITNQPYGEDAWIHLVALQTTISADTAASYQGGEVNFNISVIDNGPAGVGGLILTVRLSHGLRLVGPPAYTRGSGCTGTTTLVCNLGFLRPKGAQQANVMFGAQVTEPTSQLLTASASAQGAPSSHVASFNVAVGS